MNAMKLTNQVLERNRAVFDIFTICIDKYMLPPQTWKSLSPERTSATCRKVWRKPKTQQLQPRHWYYVQKVINAAGKYPLYSFSLSLVSILTLNIKNENKRIENIYLGGPFRCNLIVCGGGGPFRCNLIELHICLVVFSNFCLHTN